jgi:FeS assembly SUF system protein
MSDEKPRPDATPSDPAASAKPAQAPPAAAPPAAAEAIRQGVIEVAQTVFDPEIPVNIYDLGLIYGIDVDAAGFVTIRMTLTSPSCPSAEMLPPLVESRARSVPGVTDVRLDLVWEPPWNPSMMSEVAKVQLNMF